MKLILSSSDFLNERSKKVIIDNIDKPLSSNKVLFIPNEKCTKEILLSGKYYDRLYKDGFTNKGNIYIFDDENPDKYRNLDIDLIYVGGGNAFATLNKIRKSNFDKDIINYINKGVIYIGGSAGAHLVTKSIKHLLTLDDNYINMTTFDALGLVDFLLIPHFDDKYFNSFERKEVYKKLLKENEKVYKLNNDESLVVTENKIEVK